jgi:hypothetical protein
MTIEVDPPAVHDAWSRGAEQGRQELVATRSDRLTAGRADLGELQDRLAGALETLEGVTTTALRLLDELHENVYACLADYRRTDGSAAGTFVTLEEGL